MDNLKPIDSDWEMPCASASASSSYYQASSTSYSEERHLIPVRNVQPRQSALTYANKPQIPSKGQWEELKPVIYRLYIKEGKRLKDVLRELRRENHCLITYDIILSLVFEFFSRLTCA
jgi:hypothetical protein